MFKLQPIVSLDRKKIGYEVLLDFDKAMKNHGRYMLTKYYDAIDDGSVLTYLMDRFFCGKFRLTGLKIFINVERHNLCNKVLLKNIVTLSSYLYLNNDIELVVEITERNYCGSCKLVLDGLRYLKSKCVSIAVDDYDIYGGDFRKQEINIGLYSYIKINMPENEAGIDVFNNFVKNSSNKIIVERVESEDRLDSLNLKNIYGLQGYAFL